MELKVAAGHDLAELKKLYTVAFPKQERKPFWFIKYKASRGSMEILEIYEDGFAGLAIMAVYRDLALLTFFATLPEKRNGGLGSKALQMLLKRYEDKRFYLEIELPTGDEDDDIKLRRKGFYMRNGLAEAGINVDLFGIPMEVMSSNCSISDSEYHELYDAVIGRRLSKHIKSI